jgi:hypothetical protein
MEVLDLASRLGISETALDRLMHGDVPITLADRLDTTQPSLQAFVDGSAEVGVAAHLGCSPRAAQRLRDEIGREGAIGVLIGLTAAKCVLEESRRH